MISCGLVLSACGLPTPAVHLRLHVAADGRYELNQIPVNAADLPRLLSEQHARTPELQLQVHASPQVDIRVVQQVVQAAKDAQVRIAFADELNDRQ